MTISAAQVKELRQKTGAGMMDAKKALEETDGDMDAAFDWLRTKGLAKAAKKSDRTAADGLVGVTTDGHHGVVLEVNAETDFVARNEHFQDFVRTCCQIALEQHGHMDAIRQADYPNTGRTVEDELTHLIATIGENMSLRRARYLSVHEGLVVPYVHNKEVEGMGKIGVLVALESAGDTEKLEALGRHIAMHIAATNPLALSRDDLDANDIERERNVLIEQARESGKPETIIEKMVEGRLSKYFEEVCLLEQTFVIDGESKVSQVLQQEKENIGAPVDIKGFARFALGEGIETDDGESFADEVKRMAG